ncbi:pesticin C-terminus-like muramidase [Nitrospirillum sp. BR 11828]|uniref:pesticin C-terminus-like muramidase n=1 Tax=Nitrospirillum sp. BR 11828 TaxID=3104325 RepID=UPI002ACAA184|nr:pesticin C-terminus-like muramidase [Nitrospirillum sp. BR 11828]MDZ5648061.1 pesticin C-terminus-like muramidase [Nitrospirillum sp. BR 11828]
MTDDLSKIRSDARTSGTVLDDPDDLENLAIFHWLGHHALINRKGARHFVIGSELLTLFWQARFKKFGSADEIKHLLVPLAGRHPDTVALGTLTRLLTGIGDTPHNNAEVIDKTAAAILAGRLWFLDVPRRMPVVVTRTDPAVYQALNGQYGTTINFTFLSQFEGGQQLRGYVPFGNDGLVAGSSGMTVATGFDVGQKSEAELKAIGLPQDVITLVSPFAKHKFKGMTKIQVAKWVKDTAPLPILTKAQADAVDKAVHGDVLNAIKNAWDQGREEGVPAFTELPTPWQTVLFSRAFHQGNGVTSTSVAQPFFTAAFAGKWDEAVTALRNYAVSPDWYKQRVASEAAYLDTQKPPPVKPPGRRG